MDLDAGANTQNVKVLGILDECLKIDISEHCQESSSIQRNYGTAFWYGLCDFICQRRTIFIYT